MPNSRDVVGHEPSGSLSIDSAFGNAIENVGQDTTDGREPIDPAVQASLDHWSKEKEADHLARLLYPYCDSDEVNCLLLHAQNLQANQDYTAAFSTYGKILRIQLSELDFYAALRRPEPTRTIGRIITLLFDQYPELSRTDQARRGPDECRLAAFTKLPIKETDDLDTMIALRAVADWLAASLYSESYDEADRLYDCTYTLMEKAIGPDHIETLRLIHNWGQMCSQWKYNAAQFDAARAEKLYQRALAGFSKFFGGHDLETLDCAHKLGQLYLTQGRYPLAEALFLRLYTEQRDKLGGDDDRTLRSLAALAQTYRLQDKEAQARALVWTGPEYDSHKELNFGRVFEQIIHVGRYHYVDEILELSRSNAPKDLCWESRALSCLPIRQAHFTAALPSDQEKLEYWHHCQKGSSRELSGLHHTYKVVEDKYIDLVIPYIPYTHFLQSHDFSSGFLYKHYIRPRNSVNNIPKFSTIEEPNRANPDIDPETSVSANLRTTLSKYVMADSETSNAYDIVGFFNGIPGDTAIVDNSYNNSAHTGASFNFVSSDWVDYKQFTLHKTAEQVTPKLTAADGSTITCHGYISGTWTDFNAKSRWSSLMVFVVDAVFCFADTSTLLHHFLFSSNSLEGERRYSMTSEDTRSFCALLNPTLLLHSPVLRAVLWGVFYPDGCGIKVKGPSQVEMLSYEEMSRREAWDREFENNIPYTPKDESFLKEQKEKETHLREEWDLKFRQSPTQDSQVGKSNEDLKAFTGKQKVDDNHLREGGRLQIHAPTTSANQGKKVSKLREFASIFKRVLNNSRD